MPNVVDVYPYKIEEGKCRFLLLRRSSKVKYAGHWRMVGGKVKDGENAWETALRELEEETGLIPEVFWCVPSINHYYDHVEDSMKLIPVFAAEFHAGSEIDLDKEHDDYQWIGAEQVHQYVLWPEQSRLIKLINTLLTSGEILDDWKISF